MTISTIDSAISRKRGTIVCVLIFPAIAVGIAWAMRSWLNDLQTTLALQRVEPGQLIPLA